MSLNPFEHALFTYWERQPDERRHWQARVAELTRGSGSPVLHAPALERELWEHFRERSPHVPALRELNAVGLRRVSLLNLAEHVIRLWGPVPKPRRPGAEGSRPG
ncbi:MAG: hypothetical protein JNG83_00190 [Opitutaceae bacterium]|nr:hypothetical protein [Opitutaceae bacterium]